MTRELVDPLSILTSSYFLATYLLSICMYHSSEWSLYQSLSKETIQDTLITHL